MFSEGKGGVWYLQDVYKRQLLYGSRDGVGEPENPKVTGVYHKYTKTLLTRDISCKSRHTREKSQSLMVEAECGDCHGKRLNAAALNCKINGYSIADLCEMELTELRDVLSGISNPQTELLRYTLIEGLDRMICLLYTSSCGPRRAAPDGRRSCG